MIHIKDLAKNYNILRFRNTNPILFDIATQDRLSKFGVEDYEVFKVMLPVTRNAIKYDILLNTMLILIQIPFLFVSVVMKPTILGAIFFIALMFILFILSWNFINLLKLNKALYYIKKHTNDQDFKCTYESAVLDIKIK